MSWCRALPVATHSAQGMGGDGWTQKITTLTHLAQGPELTSANLKQVLEAAWQFLWVPLIKSLPQSSQGLFQKSFSLLRSLMVLPTPTIPPFLSQQKTSTLVLQRNGRQRMSSAEVNAGPRQAPSWGAHFWWQAQEDLGSSPEEPQRFPWRWQGLHLPLPNPAFSPASFRRWEQEHPLVPWPACQPPPWPASQVTRVPPPLPSSSPISPSALWPCSLHVDTSSLGGAFNPQVLALLYLIASCLSICRAPQVALVVKNPPANAGDIKDASEFNPWVH